MDKVRTVRGEIILPAEELPPGSAEIVTVVEDISRADAPSTVVGEQRQKGIVLRPGERIGFEIPVPAERIEEGHIYSVRAHIDRAGSGEVQVGDLVSTESHPVLTRG